MSSVITNQLITMLKGNIPELASEVEWEYIVRVSRDSSILSRLASVFENHSNREQLPEYIKLQFDSAKKPYELLSQQVRFEAEELAKLISGVCDSPAIFLKGAAYVLADTEVGKGRTFSDIDLLVPKVALDKIEKKLMVYGWIHDETDEYDQMYYRKWAHEIPPLRHCTRLTVLDVHHNLVPIVSGKAPDISLFTNELVSVCDGKANTLSPAAMTLHSAIHLFYQEEYHHGFRDLSDLHLMFLEFGDNEVYWQQLFDLACSSNFELELALACRYTKLMFDTPIPSLWLAKSESSLPNKLKLTFIDWIFTRVLQPHHRLCNIQMLGLANFLAMFRGHWIKMPLHILILHTSNKAYKNMVDIIAGKGALKKKSAEDLQDL